MKRITGGRGVRSYDPLADMKDTQRVVARGGHDAWKIATQDPNLYMRLTTAMITEAPARQAEIVQNAYLHLSQARWNQTRGVYKFDETLLDSIFLTPFGELRDSVFQSLPETGIYITVDKVVNGKYLYGGFVALFEGVGVSNLVVVSVTDSGDIQYPYLYNSAVLSIYSDKPTLFSERARLSREQIEEGVDLNQLHFKPEPEDDHQYLLTLAAYLCSDEPDIRSSQEPRNKPNRHVKNTGPVRQWEVGYRFGSDFRRQLAEAEAQIYAGYKGDERNRPRVHVRRAHWHNFWTGPLKGERKLITKWVKPTIVNAEGGELPVTVWKQK